MILNRLGEGTGFRLSAGPFRQVIGGRAICPDGKARSLAHVGEPDTVWTRPAAVRVRGRYVRGYVEIATGSGLSVSMNHDPAFLRFIAVPEMRAEAFPGCPVSWVPPFWQAARERAAEAEAAWIAAGAGRMDSLDARFRVEREAEEEARRIYAARSAGGAA